MMEPHKPSSATSYRARLEAFRQSDKDRDAMVAELIERNDDLTSQLDKLNDDHENEIDSRRRLQQAVKSLEIELNEFKRATDSNNMVYALIDGDGAVFLDKFLDEGPDGGTDAAHKLHAEIKQHVQVLHPDTQIEGWNIIVQIYMSVEGLAKKLQACQIIKTHREFADFVRAFTNAQPLFAIVDVGTGKELADHKIREMLRAIARNVQCKHIIFGPAHDGGYLPVLRPYVGDSAIGQKLTLLETTPALPSYVHLGIKSLRLPGVFRSEPLPTAPPIAQAPRVVPLIDTLFPLPHSAGASRSFSEVTKDPAAGPGSYNMNDNTKKNNTTSGQKDKYYNINKDNERVETPAQKPNLDPVIEIRLDKKVKQAGTNPCNYFHLTGNCYHGDDCKHLHGERFSPDEQELLRFKARGIKCQYGVYCTNFDCLFTHHCKFPKTCLYGNKCRFAESHNMDTTPVARLFEDGHKEDLVTARKGF